ncbi:unnamed protein product [Phytomonas sp. EM1]|nr:unnamed protein product [Phytomonas sp. EM1]|eukprot:CCW64067.1 unnamed protein product [Phytomonas sp. isolate EM1]
MFLNGPITTLPPYVDPILTAVAHSLQCGLEAYASRPTGIAIELESRLGQLIAAPRLNAPGLPIISSSTAVLHPKNQHLFQFRSGLPPGCFFDMEAALQKVHLISTQGRQWAATSPVTMKTSTMMLCTPQGYRLSYAFPSYSEIKNSTSLRVGRLQSVTLKTTIHTTDVYCPEWGWDFRLAVANERDIAWRTGTPSAPDTGISGATHLESDREGVDDAVLDLSTVVPHYVRLQKRHRFPIRPFFCVEISKERSLNNPTNFFRDSGSKFESVVIPYNPAARSEARVEVEIDLPALYKAWRGFGRRRLHGSHWGAAAAVDSRDETTKAKRTATEVHPHGVADPFLRHVALEWLALLQFMCSVRSTK